MMINIENKKNLIQYLIQRGFLLEKEKFQMEILRGGVSNRTLYLQKEDGTSWVLKQALEKLRVKEDWFSHPRRIVLEAMGIEWFNKLCPIGSVPQLIFLEKEQPIKDWSQKIPFITSYSNLIAFWSSFGKHQK